MQDRYAGDIGDYGKIGLLKALRLQGMSVGINWYLVDLLDVEKKSDGSFKQQDGKYLIPEKLKICDQNFAEILTDIAQSCDRSVKSIECAELVQDAIYFNEPVPVDDRTGWHSRAMETLKNVDIVFVDPDNGMLVESVGKKSIRSIKYTFYEEVRDYVCRGSSVLIYNHRSRKKEAQYFHEICSKLHEVTEIPEPEILKITFPKCSVRDYLAVPASKAHHDRIQAAFELMVHGVWGNMGMCRLPH